MSSGNRRCLFSDYSQPNSSISNNIKNRRRSTSLKSRAQHQQYSINKINQKAFIARIRDYINCCDDRIMEPCEKRNKSTGSSSNNLNMMLWKNVLVFSVVVLINLASLNVVAARQIEGELRKLIKRK